MDPAIHANTRTAFILSARFIEYHAKELEGNANVDYKNRRSWMVHTVVYVLEKLSTLCLPHVGTAIRKSIRRRETINF